MKQLNLQIEKTFERALAAVQKARGFKSKSETIRVLVEEAAAALRRPRGETFHAMLGRGLRTPLNRKRRFAGEDDLWS